MAFDKDFRECGRNFGISDEELLSKAFDLFSDDELEEELKKRKRKVKEVKQERIKFTEDELDFLASFGFVFDGKLLTISRFKSCDEKKHFIDATFEDGSIVIEIGKNDFTCLELEREYRREELDLGNLVYYNLI